MMEAQVVAKTWNRRMRANINNEEQVADYGNYNRNFNDVYNMIQENQHLEDDQSEDEAEEQVEEAKMQAQEGAVFLGSAAASSKKKKASAKPEKGIFGRLGDKISAGLFKASKMNQNNLQK